MTSEALSHDEQVKRARHYQIATAQLMLRLEEDLLGGVFSGELLKSMHDFKLCVLDSVHEAALKSLTTKEEQESVKLLEKEAARHEDQATVHVLRVRNRPAYWLKEANHA